MKLTDSFPFAKDLLAPIGVESFARCSVFPEFGQESDAILTALRRLAERAARFGIRPFLYLNEPMGLDEDDPFWTRHGDCRGPAGPVRRGPECT